MNSSPRLIKDTTRVVLRYEQALTGNSQPPVIIMTELIQPPQDIGIERSDHIVTKWAERWTIQRPNSNFTYRIEFDTQGARGTDISVMQDNPNLTNGPPDRIKVR